MKDGPWQMSLLLLFVDSKTVKFKKREEKKKYFDFLKYWGTVSEINWKSVLLMKVNRNTVAVIVGALSSTTDQQESNKIWSN